MDYLAIENYLVSFRNNRKSKQYFKKEESEDVCLKKDCVIRLDTVVKLSRNDKAISMYVNRLSKFINIDFNYIKKEFRFKNKKISKFKIVNYLLERI